MVPIKRILCPVDLSETQHPALDVACDIAAFFAAELRILNVVAPVPVLSVPPTPTATFDVSAYQKDLTRSACKFLKCLPEKQVSEEVKIIREVETGEPAERIVALADEQGVDLIVITTHGRKGLKHLVFGSVAEKVIRTANCPVLALKRSLDDEGMSQDKGGEDASQSRAYASKSRGAS